jgi:hypothetical protein
LHIPKTINYFLTLSAQHAVFRDFHTCPWPKKAIMVSRVSTLTI